MQVLASSASIIARKWSRPLRYHKTARLQGQPLINNCQNYCCRVILHPAELLCRQTLVQCYMQVKTCITYAIHACMTDICAGPSSTLNSAPVLENFSGIQQ